MAVPLQTTDRRAVVPPHMIGRVIVATLLAVLLSGPLWQIHILNRYWPSTEADLIDEWVGLRCVLHGENPYTDQTTRDIQIARYGHALAPGDKADRQMFPYPAHAVIVLGPLVLMSWDNARLTFLWGTIPLLAIGIWACIQALNVQLSRRYVLLATYLTLCSWPVMWGLRLQQPTLIIVPLTFLAGFLLSRGHPVPAAILMASATIKPQLIVPVLLWMLLWTLTHRAWTFLLSFAAGTAGLLLWTEHILPHWFMNWIAQLHRYAGDRHHGKLPLAYILGHWWGVAATAILIAWAGFLLWKMRTCSRDSRGFGLCFALSVSISAITSLADGGLIYNHVLLFPGCLLIVLARPAARAARLVRGAAMFFIMWEFISVFVAIPGEITNGPHSFWLLVPFSNVELPVVVLIALASIATLQVRHEQFEWETALLPARRAEYPPALAGR